MQVNLDLVCTHLCESRTALKSPEIILVLLTCPLLQEDSNVMNAVLFVSIIIADISEKTLETLSKQLKNLLSQDWRTSLLDNQSLSDSCCNCFKLTPLVITKIIFMFL